MPDLSFYPESHLVAHALDNAVSFGQKHKSDIESMVDTADLALLPFSEAKPKIATALASKKPMQRYWGAMACSSFGKQAAEFAEPIGLLADSDESEVVRIRAAEFLGLIENRNPQPILADVISTTSSGVVATGALNSVTYFTDFTKYKVDVKSLKPVAKGDGVNRRIDYLNGEPYKSKPLKRNKRKKKAA